MKLQTSSTTSWFLSWNPWFVVFSFSVRCGTHSFDSPLTRQVDRVVAAAPPDERDVEEEEVNEEPSLSSLDVFFFLQGTFIH